MNTKATDLLQSIFGYDDFRPGQAQIIDHVTSGGNMLVIMPTGGGKSMCYQLPGLLRDGLAIIVSPLISLMRDQVAALRESGVAAVTINSGMPYEEVQMAWRDVDQGALKFLYLSPEKMLTENVLSRLSRLKIALIAVDEAHCVSQWGHDFRPEYQQLARVVEQFPDTPLIATTATADEATRDDILKTLFHGQAEVHIGGFDRPNIRLGVAAKKNAKQQALAFVKRFKGESGIVYCQSRRKAESFAEMLADEGFHALPYHAGLADEVRKRNEEIFLNEEAVVMSATVAFGMGIDKPNVRFILHTDIPGGVENYYQEIGRAGRDGLASEALLLYGLDGIRMKRMWIEESNAPEDQKRRDHLRFNALLAICETPTCRRQTLLSYFGETIEPCGNCDTCISPPEQRDGTLEGQKALSAIYRTDQMFGVGHIVDVLLGNGTDKVKQHGHDSLKTFGVGADLSKPEWTSILRQLVAANFLDVDVAGYGALRLNEKSRGLLRGEVKFSIHADIKGLSARKTKARKSTSGAPDLSPADEPLFEILRGLRMEEAKSRGVPPYVIFSDRALIEMASFKPQTEDAFLEINGVGPHKLKTYGDLFLTEILKHV